jgi:Protein of unknown function (DUF4230)
MSDQRPQRPPQGAPPAYTPPEEASSNSGSTILLLLLLGVACFVVYKTFFDPSTKADYVETPKEITVKYVPSDFRPTIDDANALAIIGNPQRYKREFNDLIYDFNLSLLRHVATRMNLPDSIKRRIEPEYQKHHPYFGKLYYEDFVALKDTTSNLYQSFYNNAGSNAVEMLSEVASKYTCAMINAVVVSVIRTSEGRFFAKGNRVEEPCGVAMTEGLRPLIKRLQARAAIDDFSRSQGLIQERVEKVIAELGTVEIRDKKAIDKQLQTKLFGFNVSSTNIEMSAISVAKIGFKLDNYLKINVDARNKLVRISLPEPTIISHEVYPKVDKLDIGWMRELSNLDLNKNINVLRQEFRRDVLESDAMESSKRRAEEVMQLLFQPLLGASKTGYRLKVDFRVTDQALYQDASENAARSQQQQTNARINNEVAAPQPNRTSEYNTVPQQRAPTQRRN